MRAGIIEIAAAKRALEGRTEKIQLLYSYLTSTQFKNRLAGVVEAFTEMRSDLETEKRAVLSLWKKRSRQLDRALENLAALYGDLRGIAGKQIALVSLTVK